MTRVLTKTDKEILFTTSQWPDHWRIVLKEGRYSLTYNGDFFRKVAWRTAQRLISTECFIPEREGQDNGSYKPAAIYNVLFADQASIIESIGLGYIRYVAYAKCSCEHFGVKSIPIPEGMDFRTMDVLRDLGYKVVCNPQTKEGTISWP